MKITLLCVGETKMPFLKEGINLFKSRLSHFVSFNLLEVNNVKTPPNPLPAFVKDKEAEALLKHIKPGDTLVLLDEKGTTYNSQGFATYIQACQVQSTKHLVFIIGGAYGFSDTLYKKAAHKMSLSKMTFTHDMARLIFTEQLYRAYTIINNFPYHNE